MKIAVIVTAGLFVIGAIASIGIVSFLRTAAGSRFLLAQLKTRLAHSAGIDLAYQSAVVDPFSTIHFENLTLIREQPNDRLEVHIPLVDIRYSLSLLSRRLVVEQARIERPSIYRRATGVAAQASTPTAKSDASKSSGGLESLRAWILSPTLRLMVKQFAVEGLRIDWQQSAPDSRLQAAIHDLSLHFDFHLLPRDLAFSGDFGFAGRLTYASHGANIDQELKLSPAGSAHWTATLRQQGERWIYEIAPTELHFESGGVSFEKQSEASPAHVQIAGAKLDSRLRLLARTTSLLQLDPNAFETLQIENQLQTESADGKMGSSLHFDEQQAALNAELGQDLALTLTSTTKNVTARALLNHPARVDLRATAHLARDFHELRADGAARLNEIELVRFLLGGQSGSRLQFQAHANAAADPRLVALLRNGTNLKRFGLVQAALDCDATMKSETKTLLEAADKWASVPVESDLKVSLTQPRATAAVEFTPIALQAHLDKNGDKVGIRAHVQGQALRSNGTHLRDYDLQTTGSFEDDRIEWNGELKLKGEPVLRTQGTTLMPPHRIQLNSTLETFLGDNLDGILSRGLMRSYGRWKTKTQIEATADLPTAPNETLLSQGRLQATGTTTLTQLNAPEGKNARLVVPEPIAIHHDIDVRKGNAALSVAAQAPILQWRKVGRIEATHFLTTLHSPNLGAARDLDLSIELKQGAVTLAKEVAHEAPPLSGLNLLGRASLRNAEQFNLDAFSAELNHAMVQLTADASGKMRAQDYQVRGKLVAKVPDNFPEVSGQRVRGRFELPWTLSVLHGKTLDLEGSLDLIHLSWSKGKQAVAGISGRIPVSEKLVRDGKRVRFAHLITENPFERVDYERLRPLIHGADQVRIEEVGVEEKRFGPFVGYFSIDQNMVFAHQFDFSLGSAGLAYGEMYFDMYPANLQLGLLARLTSLNLVEILPRRYLVKIPKGDKSISARSGLVVNLNKGTIDGRIDITEIGAAQLITLINVLDPKYEDGKMNLVRDALGVGYPTFVQMAFQRGYLDLGVDLSVLGVAQRFDVRGVPLSTLVASATQGIVKKTQEGPLK